MSLLTWRVCLPSFLILPTPSDQLKLYRPTLRKENNMGDITIEGIMAGWNFFLRLIANLSAGWGSIDKRNRLPTSTLTTKTLSQFFLPPYLDFKNTGFYLFADASS